MKDITVNDIINERTPSVKKLVNQLRKFILNAVPEIYEKACLDGRQLGLGIQSDDIFAQFFHSKTR